MRKKGDGLGLGTEGGAWKSKKTRRSQANYVDLRNIIVVKGKILGQVQY